MGKGDKKSARGKIWRGSYGNTRPHHPDRSKPAAPLSTHVKKKRP
ncbi:MAG: 30S ribosomal protein THX [Gammaproteobacteria bacterium]